MRVVTYNEYMLGNANVMLSLSIEKPLFLLLLLLSESCYNEYMLENALVSQKIEENILPSVIIMLLITLNCMFHDLDIVK